MKISRRALSARLDRTGAPPPRPGDVFTNDVEARLRGLDRAPMADIIGLPTARPIRRVAVGVLAIAAAVVVVIGLAGRPAPPGGQVHVVGPTRESTSSTTSIEPSIVTEPTTTTTTPSESTTTTAATPTTTIVIRPATTTTSTSLDAAPTSTTVTTTVPTTTTSVRTEPTSTTTTAPPPYMLQCTHGTTGGQSSVSCVWSESRATNFAGYRLYREVPGTNREVIFTTADRGMHSYIDNAVVQGQTYNYSVESVNAAGEVVERWPGAAVACC